MSEYLKLLEQFDLKEVTSDTITRAAYEEILFQCLYDLDGDFDKEYFIKKIKQRIHDADNVDIRYILHLENPIHYSGTMHYQFKQAYPFLDLTISNFGIYSFENKYICCMFNIYKKNTQNAFVRFLNKYILGNDYDKIVDYKIKYCFINVKNL